MGRDGGAANSDSLLGNMEAEADILAEGRAGAGLEALLAWTRLLSHPTIRHKAPFPLNIPLFSPSLIFLYLHL